MVFKIYKTFVPLGVFLDVSGHLINLNKFWQHFSGNYWFPTEPCSYAVINFVKVKLKNQVMLEAKFLFQPGKYT